MIAKNFFTLSVFLFTAFVQEAYSQTESNYLVNEPVDISPDFRNFTNTYFLADSLSSFDPATVSGTVEWQRNRYFRRMAFNNELAVLRPYQSITFPETEYPQNPELPFSIQFISPRAFRIRMNTGIVNHNYKDTLMFVKEPQTDDHSLEIHKNKRRLPVHEQCRICIDSTLSLAHYYKRQHRETAYGNKQRQR